MGISLFDLYHIKDIYEERLCIFCNSDSIEDEFHCFMICPAYNDHRSHLFEFISNSDPCFLCLTTHQQFLHLMSSESLCSSIASFSNQILSTRHQLMYSMNE